MGTSSDPLKIYGTSNNAVIESGTDHLVDRGGEANNTTINYGTLTVAKNSTVKNTTVINFGSSLVIEERGCQ